MGEFSDSALVLLGHGSTLNADSAAPTHQHAEALRRRGVFRQVLTGFWKEEPGFAGVLRGVFTPRVFVVPLFISEGYFTETVIPRELGFARHPEGGYVRRQELDGRDVHYCGPVGTHHSMTDVIIGRARDVLRNNPSRGGVVPNLEEVSLFIAGHGTGNSENSRKAIEEQVRLIRARREFAGVQDVYMEEDPKIGACHELAPTQDVVMVPFFISDGLHSFEDIPVMLGETMETVQERLKSGSPTWNNPTERHGRRIWYSRSIGNEVHMPDVILERVREAAARAENRQ